MEQTVPSRQPEPPKHPFWPTRQEARLAAWGLLLFLSLPVAALAPWLLLLPLRWLPGGDGWGMVSVRIAIVVAFVLAYRAWLDVAIAISRRVFTGKMSPAVDEWLRHEEPPPAGAWQGLHANAHLALFTALGLAVFLGYLDPHSTLLALHNTPKRFRYALAAAQWCRGNPNSVRACAFLIGVGSLALFGCRVRAAVRRKAAMSRGQNYEEYLAGRDSGDRPDS